MPQDQPQTKPITTPPAAAPAEAPAPRIATLGDFSRVLEALPQTDKPNT